MWQTRFRLVCHFVCHFYPKWQTKRIYFPLVLADKFDQRSFLLSDFSFGRFLFFGEFAKIDFACNHVRSLHFAIHVNVGINIGRGGKAGMSQPHLHLFHCDFVLDKQTGTGVPLRYNYDKPEKPRISRVFGYLARFFILFQTEKSSREVVIS